VSYYALTNFAPRIGLAYQLKPHGDTARGMDFLRRIENVGASPEPG